MKGMKPALDVPAMVGVKSKNQKDQEKRGKEKGSRNEAEKGVGKVAKTKAEARTKT